MSEKNLSDNLHMAGKLTIRTFRNGKLVRTLGPFSNKVVSSSGYGRNLILRWMAGEATYPIVINSAAIGDGNTAPADGNTALGNSLVSGIPITSMSVANNILAVDVFVADGDLPDDTYEEFGLFATLRLISRVLITSGYTKVSGEDTLFSYQLTFTG